MNPGNSANPANSPDRVNPDASINALYDQIKNDPDVLEKIDKIPFVETPLHTAAAAGDIILATEIIRLKPSFARKLNHQGLSPMHLAVQNGRISIVRRFVSINKDLVRVEGKKGLTPLHHAAENGQIDILAEFFIACPDSIGDLTVEGETALHIAAKNRQQEALQVLVGWLRRRPYRLRKSVLNQKNESQDTVLHVSTREREVQTVKFLIAKGIHLNAKNGEGSTALDIVEMPEYANAEIKNMLLNAKAKHGTNVADAPSPNLAQRLKSKRSFAEIFRFRDITSAPKIDDATRSAPKIDDATRSVLVAVAVLIATMTYQSALSPPGGVYQADASAANTTSSNSTLWVGTSVMLGDDFNFFWTFNTLSLSLSTVAIVILCNVGPSLVSCPIMAAILYFWVGYINAMRIISPIRLDVLDYLFGPIAVVTLLIQSKGLFSNEKELLADSISCYLIVDRIS